MMIIIHGDCSEVLKSHPNSSIDSVVTDPPYGLSFMGKKWDYQVPKVELWKEVLRVLKPGGHALVACGTRTQHRMAVNLEDAGFEIRDIVAWIYGSGFPKSLNISKAIDTAAGAERKIIGSKVTKDIRRNVKEDDNGGQPKFGTGSETKYMVHNITEAATDEAKEWEGWGTALKPAMELWTLARKPLSEKTVAENVLKWGTGGINIDGSRVETAEKISNHSRGAESAVSKGKYGDSSEQETHQTNGQQLGRFPANIIHDGSEEVVREFPITTSGSAEIGTGKGFAENPSGISSTGIIASCYADTGSAARFFYCAKASKTERNDGCDSLDEKHFQMRPFAEEGCDQSVPKNRMNSKSGKNHHPTVKPIALMEYLIKLITPPQGIVLDPFMGSGSTGVAAKKLGFNFIGIEREKEYVDIATARIENEIIPDKQLAIF